MSIRGYGDYILVLSWVVHMCAYRYGDYILVLNQDVRFRTL